MTVVKITLKDYRISTGHLALLSEEFYGRQLTNDEAEGTVELGFESLDGTSSEALAEQFQRALDGFITAEGRVRRAQEDKP